VRDHRGQAQAAEIVDELGRALDRIYRDDTTPGREHGEQRPDQRRPIAKQDSDRCVPRDSGAAEGVADAVAHGGQLAPAEPPALELHGLRRGIDAQDLSNSLGDVHRSAPAGGAYAPSRDAAKSFGVAAG
jgi:hypothetical protein